MPPAPPAPGWCRARAPLRPVIATRPRRSAAGPGARTVSPSPRKYTPSRSAPISRGGTDAGAAASAPQHNAARSARDVGGEAQRGSARRGRQRSTDCRSLRTRRAMSPRLRRHRLVLARTRRRLDGAGGTTPEDYRQRRLRGAGHARGAARPKHRSAFRALQAKVPHAAQRPRADRAPGRSRRQGHLLSRHGRAVRFDGRGGAECAAT